MEYRCLKCNKYTYSPTCPYGCNGAMKTIENWTEKLSRVMKNNELDFAEPDIRDFIYEVLEEECDKAYKKGWKQGQYDYQSGGGL